MRRPILYALLCASVAMPVMAQAQDADDVLVMRRAIADPKGKTTIQPSADYDRVPLTLKDTGDNRYAATGTIGLQVETVGCLLTSGDVNADETLCVDGAGPRPGDIVNFNAKMDPDLKAYYVPRAQYQEILPTFDSGQIDALCSGTVSIAGAVYQGSCDPSSVVNAYAKYVYALIDPTTRSRPSNVSTSSRMDLYVNSVGCYSTQTGNVVANSYCTGITKAPNATDVYSLSAQYVPQLREVYLDQAELAAMTPAPVALLNQTFSTFCSNANGTIKVDGNDWKVRCGQPEDPGSYTRVVQKFIDPMDYGVDRNPSIAESGSLRMVVNSTICYDAGGATVSGKCDYLTEGPNVFDIATVPATFVNELREVYVNPADVEAAAGRTNPLVGNYVLTDACKGGKTQFKVSVGGAPPAPWYFVCGTPEDPGSYTRAASRAYDPTTYGPNRTANSSDTAGLRMVVANTICYDSSGATVSGKCDYLTEGLNVFDLFTVPATYVPDLREIYVNKTDVQAATKNLNPVLGSSSLDQACPGGKFKPMVNHAGLTTPWSFVCGTPDDPSRYTRTAQRLTDPTTFGNDRTPNDVSSGALRMVVTAIGCLDEKGTSVTGKCDYLPEGPQTGAIITVPATYVPELREVYPDRAAIEAQAKTANTIITSYFLNDACKGGKTSMQVKQANGTTVPYNFVCGTPDDPSKYTMKAQTLRDPRDYGSNRNINMDPSATRLGLTVGSTLCYDSSTNATATSSAKCSWLPNNVKDSDVLWMPAVFDSVAKTVTIDINAFRALGHETNFDYNHNTTMCARNLTVNVNYVDYRLICG